MTDSSKRSFVKAVSWQTIGTLNLFFIGLLITGQPLLATGIAVAKFITGMALYYFHERVWNRITWHRIK